MDTYRNPIYTQTNQGPLIEPSWENKRGILNSHIIAVDSRNRDYNFFPSAQRFKIRLPDTYHNVYSVEVLNACIPIVGTENYVSLRIPDLGTVEGAQTTSQTQDIFTSLFDDAFLEIPLIEHFAAQNVTFWRKDELRAIKYFEPRKSELKELEFILEQWGPAGSAFGTIVPYPLAVLVPPITVNPNPVDNVKYMIEIVASN